MATEFKKMLQRIRVTAGYVFAAIFIIFCRPTGQLLLIGVIIAVVGLLIRAWACGHLRKQAELDTSGPYAYTRNPLYLGSFLITVGFAMASGVWWLAVLSIVFFLGIYLPVMRVEAKTLVELFGDDYHRYSRAVPLFFPRLTPYRDENARGIKFDPSLYMRYREYQAAMGLVVAWSILALISVFR